MSDKDECEMPNCHNEVNRVTSTETRYIFICDDCWHAKYKN